MTARGRVPMNPPTNPSENKVQTVSLVIIAAFATCAALYFLRPVLVPFTLAVFFAFVLSPLLDLQVRKLHFPRYLALVITLIIGFGAVSTVGGLIATSVTNLAADADEYQEQIENLIVETADRLPLERMGFDPDEDFDPLTILPDNFSEDVFRRASGTIIDILSQGILVMLFVIFLLLGRTTPTKPFSGVAAEVEVSVKRYIVTKVIVSTITGIIIYLVLNFIGIPYAVAFGTFVFMLNFIPSIGSIIATLLPLPVIFLIPDITYDRIALALIIPGAIQFAIGNIIEPKIMGEALDLHPVVILMSLIFWGMLWGPIGMLLAAPLMAITKIILSKIEVTQRVARLLAGHLDAFDPAT